jgi:hypothetical protein
VVIDLGAPMQKTILIFFIIGIQLPASAKTVSECAKDMYHNTSAGVESAMQFCQQNTPEVIECAKDMYHNTSAGVDSAIQFCQQNTPEVIECAKDMYHNTSAGVDSAIQFCRKSNNKSNTIIKKNITTPSSDLAHSCAMIGLWDEKNSGHAQASASVQKWIDLNIAILRGSVGNLDKLKCSQLSAEALSSASRNLVDEIENKDKSILDQPLRNNKEVELPEQKSSSGSSSAVQK